jgi:hypothetical protein
VLSAYILRQLGFSQKKRFLHRQSARTYQSRAVRGREIMQQRCAGLATITILSVIIFSEQLSHELEIKD